MSEIVGKRIEDLRSRVSKFGKEDRSGEEVHKFKRWLKNKLIENIRSDLIGLLRELQEIITLDLTRRNPGLLRFSAYDVNCILTKYRVKVIGHPYKNETIEYIVDGYMYPDLKKYRNEHNPSLKGAIRLYIRITEIEMQTGIKLRGKYLLKYEIEAPQL